MRGLALALLLAACSTASAAGPREVVAGVDACDYCHMTADDPALAAQWVGADGEIRVFDEPGCLVAWLAERPDAAGEAWVADAAGGGWVPAAEARLVVGGARTGMGFDVVAFRDPAAAAARAAETGGEAVGWSALRERGVEHDHAR